MATLVFDAAPLSAFARARRLDALDRLCATDERVTTPEVIAELAAGARFPFASGQFLPWARTKHLLDPRTE